MVMLCRGSPGSNCWTSVVFVVVLLLPLLWMGCHGYTGASSQSTAADVSFEMKVVMLTNGLPDGVSAVVRRSSC
ncbi:hypothetical protein ACOMHN_025436 [Nucella lapillus]